MSSPRVLFRVDPEVFALRPNYVVACVAAFGLNNSVCQPPIESLFARAEAQVAAEFAGRDPKTFPEIAEWRSAFSAAGWSASKFPPSVEAMIKRVARGDSLPRINPIVDLANACSLAYRVPIGAHDIDTFAGHPLTVRRATADDVFLPMGDSAAERADLGEIVYVVANDIRTRRWVWRQARTALVGPASCNVLFPIDGFSPQTTTAVRDAADLLASTIQSVWNISTVTGFVTVECQGFSL